MGLQVLMLMAWVEEDELVRRGCVSSRQGQEEQEDVVGPLGELPAHPPQQQEMMGEEDL